MLKEFGCAGAAAALAITVMHPVDVVKIRLQMQGELSSAKSTTNKPYKGIVHAFIQIGRYEGILGLYRGLPAAWLLQISVTGTRFAFYEVSKSFFPPPPPSSSSSLHHARNFVLALLAGVLGAAVGNPFYLIKSQQQIQSSIPSLQVGHQHTSTNKHHQNLLSIILYIYRHEGGLRGYWRGFDAYLARLVSYSSVQLSCYDGIKAFLINRNFYDKNSVHLHMLSSFLTAGVAVMVMQPFDMVTSRLMNQPVVDGGKKYGFYDGPLDCLVKVVRTEGGLALTKGMMANFLRMGPYTVLVFVFYEQLKKIVNNKK